MSDGNGKEPFFSVETQFDVTAILDRIEENLRLRKVLNLPDEGQPGGRPAPTVRVAQKDFDFVGLDHVWHQWLSVDSPYTAENGGAPRAAVKKAVNLMHKVFSRSQYFFNCVAKQLLERVIQCLHALDHNTREVANAVAETQRRWSAFEESVAKRVNGAESTANQCLESAARHHVESQAQVLALTEAVQALQGRLSVAEARARSAEDQAQSLAGGLAELRAEYAASATASRASLERLESGVGQLESARRSAEAEHGRMDEALRAQAAALETAASQLADLTRGVSAHHTLLETVSRQSEQAAAAAHRLTESMASLRETAAGNRDRLGLVEERQQSLIDRVGGAEKWLGSVAERLSGAERVMGANEQRSSKNEEWLGLVARRTETLESQTADMHGRLAPLFDLKERQAAAENRLREVETQVQVLREQDASAASRLDHLAVRLDQSDHYQHRIVGLADQLASVREQVHVVQAETSGMPEQGRRIEECLARGESLLERLQGIEAWHQLLSDRITAAEEKVNVHHDVQQAMRGDVDRLDGRLHTLDGSLDEQQRRLTATLERTEGAEKWLALVAEKVDLNESWREGAAQRIQHLLERAEAQEAGLRQVRGQADGLAADRDRMAARTEAAEAAVEQNNRQGERLASVVGAFGERLQNAEKWTGSLAERLDGWEKWCGRLHERVGQCEIGVAAIEDLSERQRDLSRRVEEAAAAHAGERERIQEVRVLAETGRTVAEEAAAQVRGQRDHAAAQEQWLKTTSDRLDGAERWLDLTSKRIDRVGENLVKVRREVLNELRYVTAERQARAVEPRIVDPETYRRKLAAMKDGPRINVGCGNVCPDDYINIDMRELEGVDVVADVLHLPYEPGTVAELYNAHLIEHFPRDLMRERILPYWRDLVKPGGRLRVVCPNWDAILSKAAKGEISNERAIELTFGSQEYEGNLHLTLYGPEALAGMLEAAGFEQVEVVAADRDNDGCPEMELTAIRPRPRARKKPAR